MSKTNEYNIKDMALADQGLKRINWAKSHMPIMRNLISRLEKEKPFEGLTIGICLHVEAKTGVWVEALTRGGAKIAVTGSPGSTQDETAAALVKFFGAHVYSQREESFEEHIRYCKDVLRMGPDLIADNGADLHELILRDPEFKHLQEKLLGATEETTTGANRLREDFSSEQWPTLIINDTLSKRIIENRFGVGSSVVESIAHATNVMLHGKKVVVIGYGYCGSGVAQRFRGMGAHVTVVDTNPLTRLEAHLEGFYTADLVKTLTDADFVVSVVGRDNVLTGEHFSLMKDQVIIANAGHFQREVDVPALLALSDSREEIVPKITSYRLKSGKQLFLISDANLVNLSAGNGNLLSLAYDIRKAREGCRRTEQYEYEGHDTYNIYGVELLWPLILIQLALFRRSMAYIEVNKKQLSLMYSFEHILEAALKKLMPESWEDLIRTAKCASDSDFRSIESNLDSRCCYFANLHPELRNKQLRNILCSFDPLWGKYVREAQDIKMLNEMNNTIWDWPENINW